MCKTESHQLVSLIHQQKQLHYCQYISLNIIINSVLCTLASMFKKLTTSSNAIEFDVTICYMYNKFDHSDRNIVKASLCKCIRKYIFTLTIYVSINVIKFIIVPLIFFVFFHQYYHMEYCLFPVWYFIVIIHRCFWFLVVFIPFRNKCFWFIKYTIL